MQSRGHSVPFFPELLTYRLVIKYTARWNSTVIKYTVPAPPYTMFIRDLDCSSASVIGQNIIPPASLIVFIFLGILYNATE
jgi:hypothetical protein